MNNIKLKKKFTNKIFDLFIFDLCNVRKKTKFTNQTNY